MTIAFHPENPPLIAGGTFNGSLFSKSSLF